MIYTIYIIHIIIFVYNYVVVNIDVHRHLRIDCINLSIGIFSSVFTIGTILLV